jgi:hypothetical protein
MYTIACAGGSDTYCMDRLIEHKVDVSLNPNYCSLFDLFLDLDHIEDSLYELGAAIKRFKWQTTGTDWQRFVNKVHHYARENGLTCDNFESFLENVPKLPSSIASYSRRFSISCDYRRQSK